MVLKICRWQMHSRICVKRIGNKCDISLRPRHIYLYYVYYILPGSLKIRHKFLRLRHIYMYYIYIQPGALYTGNDQLLCLFRVSGHFFIGSKNVL